MMFFEHRTFWLPKDVRHSGEFQDAYDVDPRRGIAAIADGVSSGIFSASWAKLLTESVVAAPPDVSDGEALARWLAHERQAWREPIDVDNLPWFQKPKLQQGAYTTLLWVMLAPQGKHLSYRAAAIGDSCLFHLRGECLLSSFPMENSAAFAEDPVVIGSVNRKQDHLLTFHQSADDCQPGDLLVLATDAVAAWIVAEYEQGRTPRLDSWWQMSQEAWRGMILELREENSIRYDDSTVLLLKLTGQPEEAATDTVSAMVDGMKTKLLGGIKKLRP